MFVAMKINQARNEMATDILQYFTSARQSRFLTTMLIMLLRTQTDIDLSQSRLRIRHDYVGQSLVIKMSELVMKVQQLC
jgi:hypothetical protein